MYSIKHKALVLFAAVGVLASAGANAKAVAPERACSGLCTSRLTSAWTDGAAPRNEFFETDTDSANANNPALPPYARGRGQETGGPARELIPN
ncbi:Lipoprotein [Methylorubrum aminovorans]